MNKHKRATRFPVSLFFIYLGILLLMAGIHTGIIVLMNTINLNKGLQTLIPILYWSVIAVGITAFTRWRIKKTYDDPMLQLSDAAGRVANGDFSVYVPPIHTAENTDYLDSLILNFDRMVEELGSIETLKTDFLSNVSHEIKTPIAVAQNAAEMLTQKNLDHQEQQEYVKLIMQSTKKLSSLITNILKLNKLEKQNIQPEIEEYDLCEQLCNCILQFDQRMDDKKIEFEADIEDSAALISDENLLDLVWTNILSNALKFTPEQGRIAVTQRSSKKEITVSVRDSGCGMSEEVKQHIFDKFYQGDTSHSTEGNGLGMALAYRIVQMLDGVITVESQEGEGTTFTVVLPRRKEII